MGMIEVMHWCAKHPGVFVFAVLCFATLTVSFIKDISYWIVDRIFE